MLLHQTQIIATQSCEYKERICSHLSYGQQKLFASSVNGVNIGARKNICDTIKDKVSVVNGAAKANGSWFNRHHYGMERHTWLLYQKYLLATLQP